MIEETFPTELRDQAASESAGHLRLALFQQADQIEAAVRAFAEVPTRTNKIILNATWARGERFLKLSQDPQTEEVA